MPYARVLVMQQLRQYLYFCTSEASKLSTSKVSTCVMPYARVLVLLRQYLYFCTSKASKLSTSKVSTCAMPCARVSLPQLLRQYLYFCTRKTSTFVLVKPVLLY